MLDKNHSRTINAVPLCPSLELRYSISVTADPSRKKYACGFYNAARFYYYAPALKRSICQPFQLRFQVAKKAISKAADSRPAAPKLKAAQLQAGLEGLLNRNANMKAHIVKRTSAGTVQADLNQNELLIFWLTHFDEIAALDTSIRTPEDLNKTMAKLLFEIASFDLSTLLTVNRTELEAACKTLSTGIKRALKHDADSKTSNIYAKTKIVRYAVELFLKQHDVDPRDALSLLVSYTTPQKGSEAKISETMRLQSLSIGQYRRIYAKLTEHYDAENLALLMMAFLGMTAEEVCGLQTEDLHKITGYQKAFYLQIIHRYIKTGKDYILTDSGENERTYRNIPLPRPIAQPLFEYCKNNSGLSQFLLVKDKLPFKPDQLEHRLMELLKDEPSYLMVRNQHGALKKVDISFQSRSFRVSCRFYWQYHCGMTAGEICYLGGLVPPDTASAHYIDYNNATMQYRMMKQLEYGLALFSNENYSISSARDWTTPDKDDFYYACGIKKRAHMELRIKSACTVRLSSNRGIVFSREAES